MNHEKWLEQHDRMIADHDQMIAQMRKVAEKTDKRLDRAVKLSVQNVRNELVRHEKRMDRLEARLAEARLEGERRGQELDERIGKLVSAMGKFLGKNGEV